MPRERSPSGHTYIRHASSHRTHYIHDSFADPWKPTETILIQHGFARHSAFWYHWIPVLAREYHVIRRDLRGHGRSSYVLPDESGKGECKVTLDEVVDEVIDTLDQLGVGKVHFLGESTGGMVGIVVAARHPSRLHSLTLISTPTHLPPSALHLFSLSHPSWPTACRALGSRGWAESLSAIPGTIPVADPAYLPWYLSQIGLSSGEGLAQYAEFLSTFDARPYLGEVKTPTLVLAPRNSAATSVEEQRGLAGGIEGARVVVVEGVGHEIYVTGAERCQEEFLEFVRGVGG